MKKDSHPGLREYFTRDTKHTFLILTPKYYFIYNWLRNGFLLSGNSFLASDVSKILQKSAYSSLRHKPLYTLFGRKALIAVDPEIDKKLRARGSHNSGGFWASVPPKTPIKFNPEVTVIRATDKHEARRIQSILSIITKENGATDFSLAEKMLFEAEKKQKEAQRATSLLKLCLTKLKN